jgi:hypothetical protein
MRYLKAIKSHRDEKTMVNAKICGEESSGHYCLMDTELQLHKMKRVMEIDNGDSCTMLYN